MTYCKGWILFAVTWIEFPLPVMSWKIVGTNKSKQHMLNAPIGTSLLIRLQSVSGVWYLWFLCVNHANSVFSDSLDIWPLHISSFYRRNSNSTCAVTRDGNSFNCLVVNMMQCTIYIGWYGIILGRDHTGQTMCRKDIENADHNEVKVLMQCLKG